MFVLSVPTAPLDSEWVAPSLLQSTSCLCQAINHHSVLCPWLLRCVILAELTAFIEISESTFVFPAFLNVTLLPSFIFISLILSITIFDRIVPFRVLDSYTTSSLSSCGVIFIGEFASLLSVTESISNSLNLPSHSSSLSKTSRISGLLRPIFKIDSVP